MVKSGARCNDADKEARQHHRLRKPHAFLTGDVAEALAYILRIELLGGLLLPVRECLPYHAKEKRHQ